MHGTTWTGWFMIGFKEMYEGFCLYGRKPYKLVKIAGGADMPEFVDASNIKKSFKYNWAELRFQNIDNLWDADAVIIKSK
jgi:hypothetical protein